MTHREYFKNNQISIEQYGVFLVRLYSGGKNTPHGNKGFDISNAKVLKNNNAKIEVKSKITKNASVIHCNKNKFDKKNGMTHLAVVLVDQDLYEIKESWLLTADDAKKLSRTHTKSKYINVSSVRNSKNSISIKTELNNISKRDIGAK